MDSPALLELVHTIDPTVIERAKRLQIAIRLLQEGKTRREASGILHERCGVSRMTAWRLVDAANDIAGA